ncbi:hypothetical protein L1987_18822 [Smallanthus sonchifolius]|uniref:Uncharacterized protein n=1 Tax=Smallanthus sonchifolius TaxID=185202 RepID=A0ACB9J4A1_9ASTR|nr:hypothetical protein L1987_18822 [Smallanthus sonchifolius]
MNGEGPSYHLMHTMVNPKDYAVFEGLVDILPDIPDFAPEPIAPPPSMEIPGNPELPTVAISEEVESALRPEPNTLQFMVYQGSYSASSPVAIQRPTKPLTERQRLINRLMTEE